MQIPVSNPDQYKTALVTISDSRHRGDRPDLSTDRLKEIMQETRLSVVQTVLVPDEQDQIEAKLIELAQNGADLVLTCGGTGLAQRDVTPEATEAVIDRKVPGLAEAARSVTAEETPLAWLSRATAGLLNSCLIVNLPGSPRAASECLRALLPLLPHALDIVAGSEAHE